MNPTLIDTSTWIAFFRAKTGTIGDVVATLIEEDRAWLTGPVLAELLQGVRSETEARQLVTLFGALPYIEPVRQDWLDAGQVLRELRRRGITVPLTDALISSIAVRVHADVLTLDSHFQHLPAPLLKQ